MSQHTQPAAEHAQPAASNGYQLVTYVYPEGLQYIAAHLADLARWVDTLPDANAVGEMLTWRDLALAWLTVPGARLGELHGHVAVLHPDGRLLVLQGVGI